MSSNGSNEPKRKPIEETILAVVGCDALTKKVPHSLSKSVKLSKNISKKQDLWCGAMGEMLDCLSCVRGWLDALAARWWCGWC